MSAAPIRPPVRLHDRTHVRTPSRASAARRAGAASALLALLLAAVGCAGSGPDADRSKPPAQIETEAKAMDRPQLEQVVADYQSAIHDREGALAARERDVREKAGGVIDAVLGTGDNDGVRAEVAKLKESAKALADEVRSLNERLAIYSRELARRE